MSRWVEVEPLIEAHYQHCNEHHGEADVFYTWSLELMRKASSLDLVRCAECKFKRLYDGETKYYYCALEDRPNRHWSVDDWNYCFWGERKESE